MSGPFKMKGNPLKRNFNLKVGKGQGSKREGKYISKKTGKYTVDLDAPGYKYGPGYEPTEEKTIPVTSPFTQKEEKKNILETIHRKVQKIKDPLQKYKFKRKMRKAKKNIAKGKGYVHEYETNPDGSRGKLKKGYPKWE